MKNRITTLVLATAVALAAGTSMAAPAGKFGNADTNKDRALSKAEACAGKTPRICKRFEAIDSNRDGVVTRAEIKASRDAKRAAKGLPAKS